MPPVFRMLLPAAALAIAVAGCGGDHPTPDQAAVSRPATQSLRGTPLIPGAVPVTSAVGTDAADAVFNVHLGRDSVANWYRTHLSTGGWTLETDGKLSDGTISLHATRKGPPLWVLVRSTGVETSQFTVIGAVADTGAKDSAER